MNARIKDFFKYSDGSGYQKLYPTNYYIKTPDKIKSLVEIQEIDKRTAEEIKHLFSRIELLKLYRTELYNRFQEINAANFRLQISIERQRQYYENKVFYYITAEQIPDRTDVAPIPVLNEKYAGKDRRAAFNRFEELCKQYPHAEKIKNIEKSKWE